ncbi:hypothetical protein Poly41_04600 [Novipirellula artificiosorum]|uniref:Uncharacterized protein n=1 Tax=Novipirellula artificiosorum TaxID=2528016 RepID=A0A5C6E121_9BACT|nr:hypothetical protein Poly41_04600 [Novipirellula artificiosorum]
MALRLQRHTAPLFVVLAEWWMSVCRLRYLRCNHLSHGNGSGRGSAM